MIKGGEGYSRGREGGGEGRGNTGRHVFGLSSRRGAVSSRGREAAGRGREDYCSTGLVVTR